MSTRYKAKRILSITLRIGVSFALLVFLFRQIDKKALLGILASANIWLLAGAFFIFLFTYIISLYRWEMLLKAVKVHLSIKRIIVSFSAGLFFNLFLPSTIGGDLVRSFDLATHTKKPKEIIASVLLERISGYAGLVLVALVALFYGYGLFRDKTVIFIIGLITLLLIAVLLVLFNNFFFGKINRLFHSPAGNRLLIAIKDTHQEMYYFRHRKRILLVNLLYSILIQVSCPFSFYLIALALGVKTSLIYFFIFIPIINAVTMLPISIGGLGLRDATVIYFFSKVGMPKDFAFAVSITVFFFTLLIGALGGLIYVFTLRTRRIQHHQAL